MNKKWGIGLIVALAMIIIFFGAYIFINNSSALNNYKNQSIELLKNYETGKMTKEDAKTKIEAISKKVEKEYESDKSTGVLILTSTLQRIEWDLIKGEISNTEVNDYIREIKNIK